MIQTTKIFKFPRDEETQGFAALIEERASGNSTIVLLRNMGSHMEEVSIPKKYRHSVESVEIKLTALNYQISISYMPNSNSQSR